MGMEGTAGVSPIQADAVRETNVCRSVEATTRHLQRAISLHEPHPLKPQQPARRASFDSAHRTSIPTYHEQDQAGNSSCVASGVTAAIPSWMSTDASMEMVSDSTLSCLTSLPSLK